MSDETPPEIPFKFVEVFWEDSSADHNWCDEAELPEEVNIVSRGWRIKNTKKNGITLAASVYKVHDKWFFGETITIPRKAVLSEREM